MIRYPILWLTLGLIGAVGLALMIVNVGLDLSNEKMQTLFTLLILSGTVTLVITYISYRFRLIRWFPSLRWALLAVIFVAVLLIMLNVWVTVRLMFISEHDSIITAALLLFAGILAMVFGLFVSSTLTDRINTLSKATDQLAEGKFQIRLGVKGNDELAALSRRFNWMAASLQQIDEQKRQVEQTRRDLIAGVSHDLRTPITSIRAMLEAIQDGVVTDTETTSRYIKNSLTEINNLSHLIDDLFQLAQLDAGHIDAVFENASLKDLVSDLINSMRAKAKKHYIKLACDIDMDVDPVYMAPDKIQRVLYNLLDNAIRYTPAYGEVTLRAYLKDQNVCVEVHNTGDAIDPNHLPRIFESFYRGESSRVQGEDGHRSAGLGLAIAKRFIEIHRGQIAVDSRPNYGTTFSIAFPKQQQLQMA